MDWLAGVFVGLEGGVVGYTSGVFDLLHDGHRKYLSECRRRCDFLIVGVDEDALVKRNKGADRPFQTCDTRLNRLANERAANFLFRKICSFEEIAKSLRPNRFFIPNNRSLHNQRLMLLREIGAELVILPYTDGISTSTMARGGHRYE